MTLKHVLITVFIACNFLHVSTIIYGVTPVVNAIQSEVVEPVSVIDIFNPHHADQFWSESLFPITAVEASGVSSDRIRYLWDLAKLPTLVFGTPRNIPALSTRGPNNFFKVSSNDRTISLTQEQLDSWRGDIVSHGHDRMMIYVITKAHYLSDLFWNNVEKPLEERKQYWMWRARKVQSNEGYYPRVTIAQMNHDMHDLFIQKLDQYLRDVRQYLENIPYPHIRFLIRSYLLVALTRSFWLWQDADFYLMQNNPDLRLLRQQLIDLR